MPIPPGSLWGSAVRGGELSACPTKSPFRDMNLNKAGMKRRWEQMHAAVTVCVLCLCMHLCMCVTDGE